MRSELHLCKIYSALDILSFDSHYVLTRIFLIILISTVDPAKLSHISANTPYMKE